MEKREIVLLPVLCLLFLLGGCENHDSEPSLTHSFRSFQFLGETTVIGNSERGIAFSYIQDVEIDGHDNILVLDHKHPSLLIYNMSGEMIQKIGRPGHGPGRFIRPSMLFIRGKKIYVYDSVQSRITRLDHNYRPDGFHKINGILKSGFFVNSQGKIFGVRPRFEGRNRLESICCWDSEGNQGNCIHDFVSLHFQMKGDKDGKAVISATVYPHTPVVGFRAISHSRFCYGYSNENRLYLYDTIHRDKTNFSLVFQTRSLSPRQKTYYHRVETSKVLRPQIQTSFYKILSDREKRIYILRPFSLFDEGDATVIDTYNTDGEYLYSFRCPHEPLLIRGNRLLYMRENNAGKILIVLRRFHVGSRT